MSKSNTPILELPAALVEELLAKNDKIGSTMLIAINSIQRDKPKIRDWLVSNHFLSTDAKLEDVDTPTTCGIDGSYVLEHMLSISVVACAAVAVEGFTPPSEIRHWPLKYESLVEVEGHNAQLGSVARGLMKIQEAKLAIAAPHDVVLLDGSVTSNIIHMNQAVSVANDNNSFKTIDSMLLQEYGNFLNWFKTILDSEDDKIFASLSKYTTRAELGDLYDNIDGWPQRQDDKSVMTAILEPGEYTKPQYITRERDLWHLPVIDDDAEIQHLTYECLESMKKQMVLYYKPHDFTPALRIEVGDWAVYDDRRLAILLRSLKFQYASYAIMEPYPLYMADRMVKSLGGIIPTLRQSALQNISKNTSAEIKEILFSIRGYRTEGGR